MMRPLITAAALAFAASDYALAADMTPPPMAPPPPPPYYAPVPPPMPFYNWSGPYIGGNGGGAFGTSSWSGGGLSSGNFNTSGGLAGGTLGFNTQWGPLVLGIEGDGDWTNLSGTTTAPGCGTGCQTSSDWLATVRGRVGGAFDRVLFYGTGGVAFGPIQSGFSGGPSETHTEVGWTAGAGLEFAIAPRWTAKVEYLYVYLQPSSCTADCFLAAPATPTATSIKFNENVIRAGLNFKFGPWWW